MDKRKNLTISIQESILEELRLRAELKDISLSKYVNILLKNYFLASPLRKA